MNSQIIKKLFANKTFKGISKSIKPKYNTFSKDFVIRTMIENESFAVYDECQKLKKEVDIIEYDEEENEDFNHYFDKVNELVNRRKKNNKTIINSQVNQDYTITNNIIKEAFSFAYNFDTGVSRKNIIHERIPHIQDQVDIQEEWMNDRITLLEQKAANMLIESVEDTKQELYKYYSVDKEFKDILIENDEIVISPISNQVSQDLHVADMNPNFSVTEDLDEKTDEYTHEGYSVFDLAYNGEAEMINEAEKYYDKGYIKSIAKH